MCIERRWDARAVGRAWRVRWLQTRSPEEDGHRAARRGGPPATGMGRPRVSRARACSAGGARQWRASDRAREAQGSARTEEGAARTWGSVQSGQQAAGSAEERAAAIPVATAHDGCRPAVNWRLRASAVGISSPIAFGEGCSQKSAKYPAGSSHATNRPKIHRPCVSDLPTPIYRVVCVCRCSVLQGEG